MTIFFHCIPYKYNIRLLTAVLTMLLGASSAFPTMESSPSGKPRIAVLGDSMSWIGGDSCQYETGWTHILSESGLAGSIDIFARSGATWTNTESTHRNPNLYTEVLHDDNVVYNQAIRLIERADTSGNSPDIIILFAGANDAWFASKRPGLFEPDSQKAEYGLESEPGSVTTLEGSIRLTSDILCSRFPNATLIFIAPLQMSKTDAETVFRVSDVIERTSNAKGWKTLRADRETGITHQQEAKSPEFTYDGVHTNPAGAKILGEYITNYLQNLITPQPHN